MDIFCMTSFEICFFLLSFTAIKKEMAIMQCETMLEGVGGLTVREEFSYKEAPTSLINVLDL